MVKGEGKGKEIGNGMGKEMGEGKGNGDIGKARGREWERERGN